LRSPNFEWQTIKVVESDDHEEDYSAGRGQDHDCGGHGPTIFLNESVAVKLTDEHGGRGSGSDGKSIEDLPIFAAVDEESGR
jgi:hypothetical protein